MAGDAAIASRPTPGPGDCAGGTDGEGGEAAGSDAAGSDRPCARVASGARAGTGGAAFGDDLAPVVAPAGGVGYGADRGASTSRCSSRKGSPVPSGKSGAAAGRGDAARTTVAR
ncbi:MAG: hypothetical protein ABI699_01720 [Caldimonas sp.]